MKAAIFCQMKTKVNKIQFTSEYLCNMLIMLEILVILNRIKSILFKTETTFNPCANISQMKTKVNKIQFAPKYFV